MSRVLSDIMVTDLLWFSPDTNIHKAIQVLIDKHLSGAPVLDDTGALVGMLSKKDCLKIVFSAAYHQDRGGPVSDYMSPNVETLPADMDIVSAAQKFLESSFRRFPVLQDGKLVGQVSRIDILRALAESF